MMDQFIGVFLGALVGALVGWWLLVRENERLDSRRVNNDALASLGRAMHNYLVMAASADPADVEFVARQARSIGGEHMGSFVDSFDAAEQTALSKLGTDLAQAVREIGAATTKEEKADLYGKWEKPLDEQHLVLRRAAFNLTRPGIRSLFRSYE
jgi:gas vesicle protein